MLQNSSRVGLEQLPGGPSMQRAMTQSLVKDGAAALRSSGMRVMPLPTPRMPGTMPARLVEEPCGSYHQLCIISTAPKNLWHLLVLPTHVSSTSGVFCSGSGSPPEQSSWDRQPPWEARQDQFCKWALHWDRQPSGAQETHNLACACTTLPAPVQACCMP